MLEAVFVERPCGGAGEAVARQRAFSRELREDHGNAAANCRTAAQV
jgi:hypothetical protein